MSKKRPLAPPASPTDEWGIYDPAKAGMQALYSRLGRPILRASAASERRSRKRGVRPDRPADGVGLAIKEARRRAGLLSDAQSAPVPSPPESTTPVPTPPVAPPPPVVAKPVADAAGTPKRARTKAPTKAGKRKPVAAANVAASAMREAPVAPAVIEEASPHRAGRKIARGRQAGPSPAAVKPAPAVPPPSPRRPRGPVPLAAWAHAVSDAPRPEPKRAEGKGLGLWRGIFRIPSEVALVEYGRGCRIHRLVIETAPDRLGDPF